MYSSIAGDSDSSCFGKVKSKIEKLYRDRYPVVKEECRTHLKKTGGGGGKMGEELTEEAISQIR